MRSERAWITLIAHRQDSAEPTGGRALTRNPVEEERLSMKARMGLKCGNKGGKDYFSV